eukprot:7387263-Prymnesium_polylepis.1
MLCKLRAFHCSKGLHDGGVRSSSFACKHCKVILCQSCFHVWDHDRNTPPASFWTQCHTAADELEPSPSPAPSPSSEPTPSPVPSPSPAPSPLSDASPLTDPSPRTKRAASRGARRATQQPSVYALNREQARRTRRADASASANPKTAKHARRSKKAQKAARSAQTAAARQSQHNSSRPPPRRSVTSPDLQGRGQAPSLSQSQSHVLSPHPPRSQSVVGAVAVQLGLRRART